MQVISNQSNNTIRFYSFRRYTSGKFIVVKPSDIVCPNYVDWLLGGDVSKNNTTQRNIVDDDHINGIVLKNKHKKVTNSRNKQVRKYPQIIEYLISGLEIPTLIIQVNQYGNDTKLETVGVRWILNNAKLDAIDWFEIWRQKYPQINIKTLKKFSVWLVYTFQVSFVRQLLLNMYLMAGYTSPPDDRAYPCANLLLTSHLSAAYNGLRFNKDSSNGKYDSLFVAGYDGASDDIAHIFESSDKNKRYLGVNELWPEIADYIIKHDSDQCDLYSMCKYASYQDFRESLPTAKEWTGNKWDPNINIGIYSTNTKRNISKAMFKRSNGLPSSKKRNNSSSKQLSIGNFDYFANNNSSMYETDDTKSKRSRVSYMKRTITLYVLISEYIVHVFE